VVSALNDAQVMGQSTLPPSFSPSLPPYLSKGLLRLLLWTKRRIGVCTHICEYHDFFLYPSLPPSPSLLAPVLLVRLSASVPHP